MIACTPPGAARNVLGEMLVNVGALMLLPVEVPVVVPPVVPVEPVDPVDPVEPVEEPVDPVEDPVVPPPVVALLAAAHTFAVQTNGDVQSVFDVHA
jgi:hypothetical protein